MPLNGHDEAIRTRIFKRFDNTVGGPGTRDQVRSECFDGLMVMAVYRQALSFREPKQPGLFRNVDAVGRAIARRTLLVFDRLRHLRLDVLNQRATTRDVQNLHTEADRKHRNLFSFRGVYQQNAVQSIRDRVDVIRLRNQADVNGSTTSGLNSLAVITRKIKAIGWEFNAHRNADAWSSIHAAIITYVTPNALLDLHSNEFL